MQDKSSSFMIIKPDAVSGHNEFDILRILQFNGFTIEKIKKTTLTIEQTRQLYQQHINSTKFKFSLLENFMTSGQSYVLVVSREGNDCVSALRDLCGPTNPNDASYGTIRKAFGVAIMANAVHCSDSHESFVREHQLFFAEQESSTS